MPAILNVHINTIGLEHMMHKIRRWTATKMEALARPMVIEM
jgi:hypothetical protein